MRAVFSDLGDAGFFTSFFFGFGVAFFALGLRPTLALPTAVFGPGFFAAAFVVLLAGARPVCAFGRDAGLAAVRVAYVRVAMKHMRLLF